MKMPVADDVMTREEYNEERDEIRAQIAAGVLDVGQDDSDQAADDEAWSRDMQEMDELRAQALAEESGAGADDGGRDAAVEGRVKRGGVRTSTYLLSELASAIVGVARTGEFAVDDKARAGVAHSSAVPEVEGMPMHTRSCFSRACYAAGVDVPYDIHSVKQLTDDQQRVLASSKKFKLYFVAYGVDDKRNHIELVQPMAANARTELSPLSEPSSEDRTVVCTTVQHFFNKSNEWAEYRFYSVEDTFGVGLAPSIPATAYRGEEDTFGVDSVPPAVSAYRGSGGQTDRVGSVMGESVAGGQSNVSGGVARSKRRTVKARAGAFDGPVAKNYRTSNAIMFNNVDEMFQDKVSRDFAQEIVEELFQIWGVPMDQPEAAKYAEDVLWSFLIAATASNKADYNKVYDVPVRPVSRDGVSVSFVEADMSKLALLLESGHGVTRRQFARGVADDLKSFLRHDENQQLLPNLATRVGCESSMAYLAFDGSTHCTGLTTREVTFTKTLESRNLFERDDVIAQGASDKLMQGMSGGRSVSAR